MEGIMSTNKNRLSTGKVMMLIASCFVPSIGFGLLVGYLFEARGDEVLLYLVGGFIMGIIIAVLIVRLRMRREENDVSAITRNEEFKTTGFRFRSDHHRIQMVNRLVFIGIPLVVLLFWGGHHLVTGDRTSATITPTIQESILRETARIAPRTESTPRPMGVQVDGDGLTERDRRRIYTAVVRAEDRAYSKAQSLYPYDTRRSQAYNLSQAQKLAAANSRLMIECRKEVANRYEISLDKLIRIILEGNREEWPLPE